MIETRGLAQGGKTIAFAASGVAAGNAFTTLLGAGAERDQERGPRPPPGAGTPPSAACWIARASSSPWRQR